MDKEDRALNVINKILNTFGEEKYQHEEAIATLIALLLTVCINMKISKPNLLSRISCSYEKAEECIEEVNKHGMD